MQWEFLTKHTSDQLIIRKLQKALNALGLCLSILTLLQMLTLLSTACVTDIQVEQRHENEADFAVSFPSTSLYAPVPHISSISRNAAKPPV